MDNGYSKDNSGPEPDDFTLSGEERNRIRLLMEKMLAMGLFAVYGEEDDVQEEIVLDCAATLPACKAACCRLHFALTKEEVLGRKILHNPSRPFFISRDQDGYCSHLDRSSLQCTVWENRPARCRNYDCRQETGRIDSSTEKDA